MSVVECDQFLHGNGIVRTEIELGYRTKALVTALLSHFHDDIVTARDLHFNYSIGLRPFRHTFIYKGINDDSFDLIRPIRVDKDSLTRRRTTTPVVPLMPNERGLVIATLTSRLMTITSTAMGKLQTINKSLTPVPHFIEASKIQVHGIAKQTLEESTFVPIKIDNNLAGQRLSRRSLLQIDSVRISTFL